MSLNKSRGSASASSALHQCSQCLEVKKVRRRDFSEDAWRSLRAWHETSVQDSSMPLCEGCYNDLRDILIERSNEIQNHQFALGENLQRNATEVSEKKSKSTRNDRHSTHVA